MIKKTIFIILLTLASTSYAEEYDASNIGDILQDVSNLGKVTWVKGKLGDVVPIDKIEEIILIRATTSAPSEIDALNIIKTIRGAEFIESAKIDITPIHEAVILAGSEYFYVALGKMYGIIQTSKNKGIFVKPSNKAL